MLYTKPDNLKATSKNCMEMVNKYFHIADEFLFTSIRVSVSFVNMGVFLFTANGKKNVQKLCELSKVNKRVFQS